MRLAFQPWTLRPGVSICRGHCLLDSRPSFVLLWKCLISETSVIQSLDFQTLYHWTLGCGPELTGCLREYCPEIRFSHGHVLACVVIHTSGLKRWSYNNGIVFRIICTFYVMQERSHISSRNLGENSFHVVSTLSFEVGFVSSLFWKTNRVRF